MNCLLVLAAVGLKQKYNFRILEREKIHYRKNVTTVKKIVSCENSNLTKFKENSFVVTTLLASRRVKIHRQKCLNLIIGVLLYFFTINILYKASIREFKKDIPISTGFVLFIQNSVSQTGYREFLSSVRKIIFGFILKISGQISHGRIFCNKKHLRMRL